MKHGKYLLRNAEFYIIFCILDTQTRAITGLNIKKQTSCIVNL